MKNSKLFVNDWTQKHAPDSISERSEYVVDMFLFDGTYVLHNAGDAVGIPILLESKSFAICKGSIGHAVYLETQL